SGKLPRNSEYSPAIPSPHPAIAEAVPKTPLLLGNKLTGAIEAGVRDATAGNGCAPKLGVVKSGVKVAVPVNVNDAPPSHPEAAGSPRFGKPSIPCGEFAFTQPCAS